MNEIKDLIEFMEDGDLKARLLNLYSSVEEEFRTKPASIKHHHIEKGGLGRHTKEVINIALELFNLHPEWYDCTREEVMVVAFVHDFNKLNAYVDSEQWMKQQKYGGRMFMYNKNKIKLSQTVDTILYCEEHGLHLNRKCVNAISYHHGGWSDENVLIGEITPLGVLLHAADILSTKCHKVA